MFWTLDACYGATIGTFGSCLELSKSGIELDLFAEFGDFSHMGSRISSEQEEEKQRRKKEEEHSGKQEGPGSLGCPAPN